MLTNGLLGAIAIRSAASSASITPGAGRAASRPRSARRPPRPGARARRTIPGTAARRRESRATCAGARRWQAAASAPSPTARANPAGHGRERLAAAQRLGADEMDAEIEVAEPEPALAAELATRLERVPRLVRAAPAACLVQPAGERVEDRVEVRRDVEAEDLDVVADVADDRQLARVDRLGQGEREPGAAEPAGENDDSHRGGRYAAPSSAAAVRGAEPAFEPLEVGERVDVVGQVRNRREHRGHAEPLGPREEPLRAVLAVERREQVRRGERERVGRSVGRLDERDPALGQRAEQASAGRAPERHGRSALTTSTGPLSSRRSAPSTACALATGLVGDDASPTGSAAASTSSSIACARAVRTSSGAGASRCFAVSPRKGTTTVGMPSRAYPAVRGSPPDNAHGPARRRRAVGCAEHESAWTRCSPEASAARSSPPEAASGSSSGSSRGSHSSQLGRYQFHVPSSFIVAGQQHRRGRSSRRSGSRPRARRRTA